MSSIAEYYNLEVAKLKADSEKISLFTDHAVTLGSYREARLREYLSQHVGGKFVISSGFVANNDPESDEIYNNASLQIDVLVYDFDAVPLLKTTDFAVINPNSVAAVIEVKSDLTLSKNYKSIPQGAECFKDKKGEYIWAGTLVDALNNILASITVLTNAGIPRDSYFTGIISYGARSIGQFEQAMTSGELPKQLGVKNLDDLPTDICVLGHKWFGFSAYKYNWTDPINYDVGSNKDWAFLLESDGKSQGGAIQSFTAVLNHTLTVGRNKQEHRTGGLRSVRGMVDEIIEHKVPINSSRHHGK